MKSLNVFTLIKYTQSEDGWHDRGGQYHKGKDSELKIDYFNSEDELVNKWAQYKLEAASNKREIEVTVLINGVNPEQSDDLLNDEEGYKLLDEFNRLDNLAFDIYLVLAQEKKKKDEELKLLEEKKLQLKIQEEKQAVEEREKQQLKVLLAKYK